MKIGVAQWCLDRSGADAIYYAAELGLEAIHINPNDPHLVDFIGQPEYMASYQKASFETKVDITALACNILDRYPLTQMQEYIFQVIDLAGQMAIPLVYVPSFEASEICNGTELFETGQVLKISCEYIANRKIKLATENTLGIDDNNRLITIVNNKKFYVMLDTYNPVLWGHDPSQLVDGLWPHICDQIHAKDGINNIMGSTLLNKGEAQFKKTIDSLKEHGFDGTIILENEYANDIGGLNIRRDIEEIKSLFDKGRA